jgi:tetratricopeptide (TPR) repeat protein
MGCTQSSQLVTDSIRCIPESSSPIEGISVHALKHTFLQGEVLDAGLSKDATFHQVWESKTKDTNKNCESGQTYIDCLKGKENIGPAKVMLSYNWENDSIGDIVETLMEFCESNSRDPKDTYVWIDYLCMDQHVTDKKAHNGQQLSFEDFSKVIQKLFSSMDVVVSILSPPISNESMCLNRLWYLFELLTASSTTKSSLSITIPPRSKVTMLSDLENINRLFRAFNTIKIQDAKAFNEKDQMNIFKMIAENHNGFDDANTKIKEIMYTWFKGMIEDAVTSHGNEADPADPAKEVDFAKLCHVVGAMLLEKGDYSEAMRFYKKCLVLQEKALGTDHIDPALSQKSIGDVYFKIGDYSNANRE